MLHHRRASPPSVGLRGSRRVTWPCELIPESTKPPTLEDALREALVALRSYRRGAVSPELAEEAMRGGEAALVAAGSASSLPAPGGDDLARAVAAARHWRARDRFFPGLDLGDPVWLALLDLERAHLLGRSLTVSALSDPTPGTTVLRVLDRLEKGGWVVSRSDPGDRRRRIVSLTRSALSALASWRRSCR